MDLIEYVRKHTQRGACQCGQCLELATVEGRIEIVPNIDAEKWQLDDGPHTVDLIFFKVALVNAAGDEPASAEELVRLTDAHLGDWGDCKPFDGEEHNYMKLGGWIGDQGLAMQFMALASILGLTQLLTPYTIFGRDLFIADPGLPLQMAQSGLLSVQSATVDKEASL